MCVLCVCVYVYTYTHTPIKLWSTPTRRRSCLGVDLWLHWDNGGRPWCVDGRHRGINLPNWEGRLFDVDQRQGRRSGVDDRHQSVDHRPKLCTTVIPVHDTYKIPDVWHRLNKRLKINIINTIWGAMLQIFPECSHRIKSLIMRYGMNASWKLFYFMR